MRMKQATLKNLISFEGKGLHTGQITKVDIHPADLNHGIKIQRTDIEDAPILKVDASNVYQTERCTTIGKNDVNVHTVEHLMSALYAAGVSNAMIQINGPEVPILDGSALPFFEAIDQVGIESQEGEREYISFTESFTYHDEETGAEYIINPSNTLSITTLVDFPSSTVGSQFAKLDDLSNFGKQIAAARTFTFVDEVAHLVDKGLIKGGDLQNAVIYSGNTTSDSQLKGLAEKFDIEDEVLVSEEGILNVTRLRFQNEAARHKLLDVIGDLALTNLDIRAQIIVSKPGHTSNIALAKKIKSMHKRFVKVRDIPVYDPNIKPINDIHEISKKLQHRYPFLLVDKIIELTDKHVVGVKNVTMNEPFFTGHFPGNPVMPGVLQIEAMAQTGGILVMENVDDPHGYDTFFLRINNAKFRQPVVPGDTLIFKMELISPIRRGLCEMIGRAYVGENLVSEAELLAQIIKRN